MLAFGSKSISDNVKKTQGLDYIKSLKFVEQTRDFT